MTKAGPPPPRTVILDSEGLAKAVLRDSTLMNWIAAAVARDMSVVTSAATLVEVMHPKLNRPALDWTLSRIKVVPVDEEIARLSAQLLRDAGLHGHKHALDAMVCATALSSPGPRAILTSDPKDLITLSAERATVVRI